jgi:hypothetical protein
MQMFGVFIAEGAKFNSYICRVQDSTVAVGYRRPSLLWFKVFPATDRLPPGFQK